jgi:ribosomal RNA-processing protein 36
MSDNENNNIELNEDEYNEDVNESLSDTFSNIDEDNKIKSNEIKKDSIEETDDNKEEISEENLLINQIEEVDFKTLLKVKKNLEYNNKNHKNNKKKLSNTTLLQNIKKINKNKLKNEPREYSALVKPKIQFKGRDKIESSYLGKKFSRDPRFDNLSGKLNESEFNKNYKFVNDLANNYINKLDNVKKNKKLRKKLDDIHYNLLKKQKNFVSGWINHQKQLNNKKEIKKEINQENKKRIKAGQKPIYINKTKLNKYINNSKKNNK